MILNSVLLFKKELIQSTTSYEMLNPVFEFAVSLVKTKRIEFVYCEKELGLDEPLSSAYNSDDVVFPRYTYSEKQLKSNKIEKTRNI